MQIQVNTDNQIQGGQELNRQVENAVESALSRHIRRITRVEVHLSDQNSTRKSGERDKRCTLEARLSGLQPITVSKQADSLDLAVDKAAEALAKAIGRTLDKLSEPSDHRSASGQETP